jgi:DNA-binding transcriptional regulator YdaS (Cro superfamily)
MSKETPTPIELAAAQVGGLARLASLLGVSVQVVSNWRERDVPVRQCIEVERLTGVSRRELRPDDWHVIWPEETGEQKASA